ncbi:MAG: BON domain-containing protein [Rhodanobacter sp.]
MKVFPTMPILALAAVLGSGMTAGPVHATPRTSPGSDHSADAGQAVNDAWITTKVKSELATTKGVKSMDVSVTTKNRVVTLTGVLATRTDIKKAIAVAQSVKGVRDVDASGLKAKD